MIQDQVMPGRIPLASFFAGRGAAPVHPMMPFGGGQRPALGPRMGILNMLPQGGGFSPSDLLSRIQARFPMGGNMTPMHSAPPAFGMGSFGASRPGGY